MTLHTNNASDFYQKWHVARNRQSLYQDSLVVARRVPGLPIRDCTEAVTIARICAHS